MLLLAPHPDDEVFGCGGVLAQAVAAGATVKVVILSDGQAQGDPQIRRQESLIAARRLGLPEPTFWGLADRSLDPADGELAGRLEALLVAVRPRIILVPSPAEIHPDHRALALLVYRVLQQAVAGSELHRAVQAVRLAAYEVSAVLRPNLLVDISEQWEEVLAAAKAFTSQIAVLPYIEVLAGVTRARRLTLPADVSRAEAYHVSDLRYIRTNSAAEWAAAQGPSADLEDSAGVAPLDVVVRTRNRPHLLREALTSVRTQLVAPARLVVVSDGGVPVDEVCAAAAAGLDYKLVQFESSRGRAAAAAEGLAHCTASHVVFLDDDDLFFPEHLLLLGRAVAAGITVPYTAAVQGVWSDSGGALHPVARHRTFTGEFDPNRLALINHIPLPTVAIPRQLADAVGGFDSALDLYEDWDLLLRLAARTPFVHLPQVSCEYRTIASSGAITGANPPGSAGQLAALAKIWERHGLLGNTDRLAAAVMALNGERDRNSEELRLLDEQLIEARGIGDGLQAKAHRQSVALQRQEDELQQYHDQIADLRAEGAELRTRIDELGEEGAAGARERDALYGEISRLSGLLETIYGSRTWKLHTLLERFRGGSG